MRSAIKVVVPALALIIATATTAYAQCDIACPKSLPTSVTPKVGATYTYSLLTKAVLTPSTGQKVTIKADAEVAIEDVCKAYLTLKNVAIEGVPDGADLATKVAAHPIAFGYFDGRVISACPVKGEEEYSLNIKRAALSALQLSYAGADSTEQIEEDFSGKCKTSFTRTEADADKTVFLKKKNLNRCTDRRVDLRQTSDQALGQFKELIRQYAHPLDSDVSCTVTLNKDKVVQSVDCLEQSKLLFTAEPIAYSNLKLDLKATKDGIDAGLAGKEYEKKPTKLTYTCKHDHTANEADAVVVLKKLCSEITGDTAQLEASTTFDQLVSKLKHLPEEAAASVDEAVKAGTICPAAAKRLREVFLDAAAFAASDASIKVLVKAHGNKELSVSRTTAAFTVVALKAAPNGQTIKALLPLINDENAPRPLVLGLSVLTRRYCQKTSDCETNPTIKEARDAYLAKLGKTTDKLEKLAVIKSLENLNVNKEGNDQLVKALDEIVNTEAAGVSTRVAAVQALPNDASLNDQLKAIVLKEANPNELRIAAFQKLARNAGLKNLGELLSVQEHCVKNYILSYIKNVKNSKNPVRRALLPSTAQLSEEPNKKFGITKNLAFEYGPVGVELDVIYPKDKNVTSEINVRVTRVVGDKIEDVFEVSHHQEGLDPNVGNILNLLARKISPAEFGFQTVKHLTELVRKLQKEDHTHNSLQATYKLNGKNVIFSDVFEDLHSLVHLVRRRIEKVLDDKSIDLTLAGILIDSKVVVPSISGIPVQYRINDNFLSNVNAKVSGDAAKRSVLLNHGLVAAIKASAKLVVNDNKIGYDYDAKLLAAPIAHFDLEKRDKGGLFRLNMIDAERHTLLKLKQSLKEVKSSAKGDNNIENELAVEPRSEDCFAPLILKYCRKTSTVKGLTFPNIEYYVIKPDPALKSIEFEFSHDGSTADARKYALKVRGVGIAADTEHSAQLDIAYPKDGKKEVRIALKSPTNKFDTSFSLNLDATRNLAVKLSLPHFADVDVKGKFETNKESGERTSDIKVEYKLPDDATVHTLKYNNKWNANFKRSNKEKVASADYESSFESSRRPYLNHKVNFVLRYRPLKLQQLTFEFSHGAENENRLRFHRLTNIDVKEMKPFTMNADSEIQLVSTTFDVNYDLKSTLGLVSSAKGLPAELDVTLKGKDLSKRSVAAGGSNEIDGELKYRNKGADKLDQTIDGKLNLRGKELAYNSELKQTEPGKYEGKVTLQTEKDNKIFTNYKIEATKPTKDLHIKADVETTFSYKPEKRHTVFEVKRTGGVFTVVGEVTKDGAVYLKNDLKLENHKLNWKLTRDFRSYDLEVDDVLKPRKASLVLKVRDRVYSFKLDRQPLKFLNLKVEGNDKAYIQKGDAHLSLTDPSTFNLLTKANTDIKAFVDLFSSNKKGSLKINAPKFNFAHEGELQGSIANRRIQYKAHTKYTDFEDNWNADLAPKGSAITWEGTYYGAKKSLKYSRQGDKITLAIDGENDLKIEGDRKAGKIIIKGKDGGFTLESNYRYENGKFIVDSVANNNAKLEASISIDGRKEPSKFIFESPKVKTHLYTDFTKALKKLDFDFDSPLYDRKVNAELEVGKSFKYISKGTSKSTKKAYNFELVGVPRKELNLALDYPELKFKVERPATGDKVKFTYTLNEYTESEEYPFNPHQSLVISWLSVIRQYAQSFLVE